MTVLICSATFATPALAEDGPAARDAPPIVERRTVPYPSAVDRAPLTSDQISTQSTRLIDARRGYRPYPVQHRYDHDRGLHRHVIYEDSFGVIRPNPYLRPPRRPATGPVTYFGPARADATAPAEARAVEPIVVRPPMKVVIFDERQEPVAQAEIDAVGERGDIDMVVRIHTDKPTDEIEPGTAVLIRPDGTVVEVR